jgi:tetratricopeptide (TPR) repeat protein
VARAVNSFLQDDLLRQVNRSPELEEEVAGAPHLTVREALDRAAATIGDRFRDQPRDEAAIRMAIGEAYGNLYLYQLAVPHLKEAVRLRRDSLGAGHQDTLNSMTDLATAYKTVGNYREAVSLLEDVLASHERAFGPDHPAIVDDLGCLAEVYLQAGMCDKAIPLAKQVLEKRQATLGPTHSSTVRSMHQVARSYLAAGRFEESIAWHEKLIPATKDFDWPFTTYARALQGAGRLEEANCQLRKALELWCAISDRRSRERGVATVRMNLGLNLLLQGRHAEAESVSRDSLAFLEKELPDNWLRFHAMSLVGGALLGQQEYAEAEPFLVQGYQGMKQREAAINAASKHWLAKAGDRLVRHYEATDQPEKARRLGEELRSSPGSN